MPLNIPNLLTWTRILLIPLVVGVFYVPTAWLSPMQQNLCATLIFIAAALTDWFDGWLARKLGQTSAFGAFLDPVADKLMVTATLVVLVQLGRADTIVAIVIIGREIAISALREWMAGIGAGKSVAVSYVGKLKTVAQMVSLPMLLHAGQFLGMDMRDLGSRLLDIAALLTLWSMAYYLHRAWPEITARNR